MFPARRAMRSDSLEGQRRSWRGARGLALGHMRWGGIVLEAARVAVAVAALQIPAAAVAAEPNGASKLAFASQWPDASNTGPPRDLVLKPSGPLTIAVSGTTISGLDIQGGVVVNADNVTIEMSRISASAWAVIKIDPHRTGVVVRDCTIDGQGAGPDGNGNQGIMGQGTFQRNNISNVENGIVLTGRDNLIEHNFIHDLNAGGAPHYDGIQIDGGISDTVIRQNTIINSHGAAGAIMIDNEFGPVSNIVIEGNLLAGGSYTVYSDAKFNDNPISGVSITDNHIGSGQYGPTLFRRNRPTYLRNATDGWRLVRNLDFGSVAAQEAIR
ncbi:MULTISPECIES: right-handed parallel beta-helix repeat-containing protein [Bradyrhizobium]|uniref:right-handed parallel beta-helix repeat-containing protein n=1 Tax=Bradyrhizobium TaxID=374 RepID=UPI0014552F48|nr:MULTISPECIES: right-handed parallel beta-helix repeat-containing protein [Bradyrhizobium]WQN79176.1 right-handed parallel beta-helix repeat-containing protein [Bradyrhizobium ottawaense]